MSGNSSAMQMSAQKNSMMTWAWVLGGLALVGIAAPFFRTGLTSERVANTAVSGAPRPVDFLFGYPHWADWANYFTVIAMLVVLVLCVVSWRRNPGSPNVLMAIASTAIVWQDPFMNWAPYAVYNPELWHLPEWWPYVGISPTVEPFIVIGYCMFYFGPYFPAVWILRRLQARSQMDAFVWRHPLWSMAGLILVIGFLKAFLLKSSSGLKN